MADGAPAYEGFIEGRSGEEMFGWCRRVGDDRPISLDLYVDGRLAATFVADYLRGDLAERGIGSGCFGFIAPAIRNITADAIISVKVSGTDIEVTHSGLAFSAYRQSALSRSD